MNAVPSWPMRLPSLPCPCGSGVIEDDCTCGDVEMCEGCGYRLDLCICWQDPYEMVDVIDEETRLTIAGE